MNDVSKEYSEALFSLAAEKSKEKEYAEALAVLKGLISENPKFIELLSSPCVSLSERSPESSQRSSDTESSWSAMSTNRCSAESS